MRHHVSERLFARCFAHFCVLADLATKNRLDACGDSLEHVRRPNGDSSHDSEGSRCTVIRDVKTGGTHEESGALGRGKWVHASTIAVMSTNHNALNSMIRLGAPLAVLLRSHRCGRINRVVPIAHLMLVAILLLAGCQNRKVKVEITADGERASRSFATNASDRASLESATLAYGSEGEADAELGRKFTGTFAESELPSEIGNHGAIGRLDSSLGSSRLYYEQFADRRSEWSAMRDRVESGILWMKLFGRYIEITKLKEEPAKSKFSRWWNTEVIPLVSDLYLMYSGMQATIQAQRIGVMPRTSEDFSPRTPDEDFSLSVMEPALILLAERGWITADELAAGQMLAINGNVSKRERDWIGRVVATPAVKRIAAQFDPDGKGMALSEFPTLGIAFLLWTTLSREYRDIVLDSPAISDDTKAAIRKGVWNFKLPPPFGIRMMETPKVTDAEVLLHTGAAPFLTNGRWNAEAKQVEFKGGFYESKYRYTTYNPPYYAAWALPSQRQESVFGRVVLEGQALAEYCAWENALEDDLKARWIIALEELARTQNVASLLSITEQLGSSHPIPPPLAEWITTRAAKIEPSTN